MKAHFVWLLVLVSAAGAEETLVPRGKATQWRYLDTTKAPDATWVAERFDDATWKRGPGPLGYGEEGLGSTLSFGSDKERKPITAWFRCKFEANDASRFGSLGFFLRCDDGAVMYLNGLEVARENMPEGTVTADTEAEAAIDVEDEAATHLHIIPAKEALRPGANVLAVEVHQAYPSSSDLFLDLELKAYLPGEVPERPASAAEAALEAIERAYAKAPGDMETAYAWVRAQVAARQGLLEKITSRPLPKEVPAAWRFIVDGPRWPDTSRKLPRAAALEDLDYLEEMIANCYSYAERRGADWRRALDALRASITGDIGLGTFLWRLERFMTIFGDPHSSFGRNPAAPAGRLPVVFVHHGGRLLAVKPDRTGYFEDAAPYVTGLEGLEIAKWLAAAAEGIPKASPQYQRHLIADALTRTEELAWHLGLKPGAELTLALASDDGKTQVTKKLALGRAPRERTWPPSRTKVIGDLGYLRIPEMESSDTFVAQLDREMARFRATKGLIIDVRGNGGGTQDAIKTLLPYFMRPGDPMKIINVAAYRLPVALPQPNPEGFLGRSGRSLHPVTSKVWNDDQRARIADFMKNWQPQWKLDPKEFSDWHFMGISRSTNPNAYHYDKPVIVLQNEDCFSATDNFLGALKGHPGVTLLGTTSGGGSGRMADYSLPNAKLDFTLCQMASFASTGQTYDGHGVAPDIVLDPQPDDSIERGKDTQLQAALARLRAERNTGVQRKGAE